MRPEEALLKNFPFEPTADQANLFKKLDSFILSRTNTKEVFMLKGFAGTGKTTVLTSLVKNIKRLWL